MCIRDRDYTFYSTEAGAITYGGSCSSSDNNTTTEADNITTVTFNPLSDGTYDNCTIAVTDNNSNTSDNLSVRGLDKLGNITDNFTIGTTEPVLVQITPVPTLTNDNTSDYTFFSTLSGRIDYSGDCESTDNRSAVGEDNNTVTFDAMGEGPHSNCKISVTTNDNVTSDNLSVNFFVIDTIAPVLDNVTDVRNPINSRTPNYTFSSDEAVDNITYGGSCGSNTYKPTTTSANVGNNTITFRNLIDGTTYDLSLIHI